jgi:hypothetical protein
MHKVETWSRIRRVNDVVAKTLKEMPNELCLDDTILEIKQSGTWTVENNPECVFVARTGTHISVLSVSVKKAFLREEKYAYKEDVCWGNYALEERKRIDLRSLSRSFPSYRPVSLACHPKYGNDLINARFAFASHSDRGDFNVIHHAIVEAEQSTTKHTIACLKHISLIDFTSTHPMCLWSAAASYVRPALARDIQFDLPTLGLGTSLYTVDLRSNSATFQWSPSAQETMTEGVHSISGILTDWQRDNTVWVTSKSAGKTWEIDGRMACRPVNAWSLSSSCEDSALTFQQKGFYGEGSLLTKPQSSDVRGKLEDSPILNVDTTPGAFGFHIYQRPDNRPRFQTDSLECIATPGLDFTKETSIATSSVFAFPEVADEVFVCGLSSFRVPFSQFVGESELKLADFAHENSNVLCALTMTNTGDLYCYSLLESNDEITNCRHIPDLPVGSKVVGIPHELDGKTKELEYTHWKPNGGMNLKLYLTNQYPTPMNAVPPLEKFSGTKKRIIFQKPDKKRKLHPSLDIDPDVPVFKMDSQKVGITISAQSDVEHFTQDEPVVIPLPLAEKSRKTMAFSQDKPVDVKTFKGAGRSDLSPGILRDALGLWDETDSEQDEECGRI